MDVDPIEHRGKTIASGLTPAECIVGEDEEDTDLLGKMSEEAMQCISSFSWSDGVRRSYFAGGIGGIFAIFFSKASIAELVTAISGN